MNGMVKRVCPNCKNEVVVAFIGGRLGAGVVKDCPTCKVSVLFCPDGYILQSMAPFIPAPELKKSNER